MTSCASSSRERGESLSATASTGPAFLLIEAPGPWGPAVLHSARLPEEVRTALRTWQRDLGVRPLLIRRPGRSTARGSVFVVNARHGWVERTTALDPREIADLDLGGVRTAAGVGLARHDEPLVLVCTHGRHDPCCATRGRPVAAALARSHPSLTWESSHLGGDRFAGNLAILPGGDLFGRVDAEGAPTLVDAYLSGHLDLAHHRGRCTQAWEVQAAVVHVRCRSGLTGREDVTVQRFVREDGVAVMSLRVLGETVVARVRVGRAGPARLTCHAARDEAAPTYEVTLDR